MRAKKPPEGTQFCKQCKQIKSSSEFMQPKARGVISRVDFCNRCAGENMIAWANARWVGRKFSEKDMIDD